MAFKIHLPELIGSGPLEALKGDALGAGQFLQLSGPPQDLGDCAGAGSAGLAQLAQARVDLEPAPGGMIRAHLEHALDRFGLAQAGLAQRASRAIGQGRGPAGPETLDPLIARARGKMKPAAKFPHVGVLGRGKLHKFKAQRHKISRFPWHKMCIPCLRTGVYHVSGRYSSGAPRARRRRTIHLGPLRTLNPYFNSNDSGTPAARRGRRALHSTLVLLPGNKRGG